MDGETTVDLRATRGRVGIIDVGSNSIRLVVYERASRAPLPVFNEKVLCGLARGLDATGRLNPEGVRLALANIDRFTTLAHNMKVTSLDLLATAAVRDAADGEDFMRELARRPGIHAHTVSGKDEARFSGYGVICGIPEASGVMGDLGGGSLELVALGDGALGNSTTLPVGPLRLMSSGRGDPKRMVVEAVDGVPWLREHAGSTFYAVGGAWRSFARLHMEQAGYPLHIIHHYEIAAEEARAVARLIAVQSAKSLEKMPGVSRRRTDTLPLACLALDRLLATIKPRSVVFSAFGLREGFYYSSLSEAERARHPLIAFAEEQGEGWRRFDLAPAEIFDWLSPVFGDETPTDRVLRTAACHLSDISWNDHPDYRAEQAYVRVLHLPAPGMSHRERAVLAMALAYRYKSDPKAAMLDTALHLSDSRGRSFARRLGACLRLAYNLSGGAPGLLPRIALGRTDRELRLTVPADASASLGDVTARRLESAAEAFGLKPVISRG
ncbi:exopolyphosphatase [Reyranella sp.]|uniref:Ppx/GppA phosphatase family protein n=1 Tax=Reyranella sp. TaxID=1929291 RepID=UPI003BA9E714